MDKDKKTNNIPIKYSFYDEYHNYIVILDKEKIKEQLKADEVAFKE